jgi:hypothetical protein
VLLYFGSRSRLPQPRIGFRPRKTPGLPSGRLHGRVPLCRRWSWRSPSAPGMAGGSFASARCSMALTSTRNRPSSMPSTRPAMHSNAAAKRRYGFATRPTCPEFSEEKLSGQHPHLAPGGKDGYTSLHGVTWLTSAHVDPMIERTIQQQGQSTGDGSLNLIEACFAIRSRV